MRTIPVWNNLPSEIVNSKTVLEFKTKLDKLWKNRNCCVTSLVLIRTVTAVAVTQLLLPVMAMTNKSMDKRLASQDRDCYKQNESIF